MDEGSTGAEHKQRRDIILLRHADAEVKWDVLPKAKEDGYVRGLHTRVEGTNYRARLVSLPKGQSSPLHSCSAEHIIFHLAGHVQFVAEGRQFRLEKYDMLFIPAELDYEYSNVGTTDVQFVAIVGRVDGWPPVNTYKVRGESGPIVHVARE